MTREVKTDQNYVEKLLRLIPSEIVASYLIISGIIPTNISKWGYLIISLVILAIIPFYLWRLQNVTSKWQIAVTSVAFVIWMYSLNGGPFYAFGLYKPWLASILLILWTVIAPIIIVPKNDDKKLEDKKSNTAKSSKTKSVKTTSKQNIKNNKKK